MADVLKRLAGPIQPTRATNGTLVYGPDSDVTAIVRNVVAHNTSNDRNAYVTLSLGSMSQSNLIGTFLVPAGKTISIPLDMVVDGSIGDTIYAKQIVDAPTDSVVLTFSRVASAATIVTGQSFISLPSWDLSSNLFYVLVVGGMWTSPGAKGLLTEDKLTDTSGTTWSLIFADNPYTTGSANVSYSFGWYGTVSQVGVTTGINVDFDGLSTGPPACIFAEVVQVAGADMSGGSSTAAAALQMTKDLDQRVSSSAQGESFSTTYRSVTATVATKLSQSSAVTHQWASPFSSLGQQSATFQGYTYTASVAAAASTNDRITHDNNTKEAASGIEIIDGLTPVNLFMNGVEVSA